ncbi:MAG: TonB-dependent receptor plug domain-containing protein [Bacteroidota bacterium]
MWRVGGFPHIRIKILGCLGGATTRLRFKFGRKNRRNPDISLRDNRAVHLELTALEHAELPLPDFSPATPAAVADYQELSRKSLTVARTYDSLIIDLDVVEVATKRIEVTEQRRDQRAILYGTPDSRIVLDSVPGGYALTNFLDFVRRVPGVQVINEQVRIRGTTSLTLSPEPAYFLDGFQTDVTTLMSIPIQDIEFIDVLKGASASAFGSRGANGVILVYTRQNSGPDVRRPGLLRAQLYGYHRARQFAVFDASLPENRNRPDLRTTLHWNPLLFVDQAGEETETFLTSDQTGEFRIIAQGLREDGIPFVGTAVFRVE